MSQALEFSVPELVEPALKERLWHGMRVDLINYMPEIADQPLLMCCFCGRYLHYEDFSVEHMIPRQALENDPQAVRENPEMTKNKRAGTILLCSKPLKYKEQKFYQNGCNSWKGRHYDKSIAEVLSGKVMPPLGNGANTNHILGMSMLGYLAMVSKYGYRISLMKSGVLLRTQFFRPGRYHPKLGTRYRVLFAGGQITDPTSPIWTNPFSFAFEDGASVVSIRNCLVTLPVDSDPATPIIKNVPFVPTRYAIRPDFKTQFE